MNKKATSLNYKIGLILLATSILLAVASLFTPLISNVSLKYMGESYPKTNIGFYYIFIQGWKNVKELGEIGRNNETIQLISFQLIFMIISFVAAATLIAYVIVHNLRLYFYKKENINIKKAFSLLSIAILQYLFIVNVINGIKTEGVLNVDNSSHFYVGSILIIVSFCVGLIGSIISEYKNKETITPENLFVLNTVIVMFMIVLFASNKIYVTEIDGVRETSSIFVFFTDKIGHQISDTFKNYCMIAIITTLISIPLFFITLFRFLNLREEKSEKILILLSTLYFITALFNVLFTNFAITNYLKDTNDIKISLGAGSYVTIVLGILILLSSIFTYLFKNKIIKIESNKSNS